MLLDRETCLEKKKVSHFIRKEKVKQTYKNRDGSKDLIQISKGLRDETQWENTCTKDLGSVLELKQQSDIKY